MIEWLVSPLTYAFMQRGFAAALLVGVVCSILGTYVVLKSMAFLGDALAHAVLPGVAVAYILGGNLTVGALIAAISVALSIGLLSRQGVVKEDTAIGILFAAALSLGIALISSIRTYAVDLSHILFGNLLGVSSSDLWLTGILGLFVVLVIILLYRPLLVISFDPVLAAALFLPINLIPDDPLNPACCYDSNLHPNRRGWISFRDACNTCCSSLFNNTQAVSYDAALRCDRCFFKRGRSLPELLLEYCLWSGNCSHRHIHFPCSIFLFSDPRIIPSKICLSIKKAVSFKPTAFWFWTERINELEFSCCPKLLFHL